MDSAYVLDSYALIAHFEDEAGGEQVRKVLKAAHAGKTKLYMSVINLGEIYYNTYRERGREKADEAVFMMEQLPVTIVNADMEITMEAAGLKSTHSVAYADCFAAALGIRKKAKVITGDPEFKRFGEKVMVEWL
ncbi:MAG: type II toxin-antitoxin system VapC family toxin [Desulfobacterales bacterium]|nr:type II toxin-antitoxin system VapC family toxin [Desulfobacterales bacterium]